MNYAQLVTAVTDYTENTVPTVDMNTFIRQAEQRIYNTIQFPSLRKNVVGVTANGNKYVATPSDFLSVYSLAVIENYGTANENYTYLLNKDVNFIREAYPNSTDKSLPLYYAYFGPTVSSGTISNELSLILGPTPDAAYNVELHYYYYPASIVQGSIANLTLTSLGSALTAGTYYNVALTGGSGNSATATITVSGGIVTNITIVEGGAYYVAGDVVSAAVADIGGTGVTFTATVSTVSNPSGTSWLGDNYDSVLLYGTLVEAYTYMKGETDMMTLYDAKYKEALAQAKRLGDGLEREDAYRSGQYRQQVT
jgi:hypothetical protein